MDINEQNKLFFENQTKVGRVISHLEVKCPNCWTSYYYTGQQMSRHGNHVFEKACKCRNQSEHVYIRPKEEHLKEAPITITGPKDYMPRKDGATYVGKVEFEDKEVITTNTVNILSKILEIGEWCNQWKDPDGYTYGGDQTQKAWDIIQSDLHIYAKMEALLYMINLNEGHSPKEIIFILGMKEKK